MLDIFPKPVVASPPLDFLAGSGEMRERMRQAEWSRTPLGAPSEWPAPLRHAIRVMLASRQPMCLWWGNELTNLYNDACRTILGPGHPSALGMAASTAWGDLWDELGPRADVALRHHEASATGPVRFVVERRGYAVETHYAMSCDPVPGEQGMMGGVLWTFSDVTAAAMRDRELALLDGIRIAAADCTDAHGMCARALNALAADPCDFPFAAIYLLDADCTEARLAASVGLAKGHEATPDAAMLGAGAAWPFAEAVASGRMQPVALDDPRLGRLPRGAWDRAPREAIVVPLATSLDGGSAVLVAGLNPYRVLDEAYGRFVDLVAQQLAAAIAQSRLQGAQCAARDAQSELARVAREAGQLRDLDRRKNEFFATLAHELRNPLAPLRNGLEVMRLASANPQTIEKARAMMERQLGLMVHLVDDLLDVSRMSRGKVELRREEIDLAAALRNAIEASQPLMGERGHALAAAIPAQRIMVNGDATRLAQVFSNLLNNAAKYTEPGGRVDVCIGFEGGEAIVVVKDNGIGIPTEMHERVFEIFTQVDRSLERAQGGLGIGLSIAKRMVEMHGGSIAVRSEGYRKGTEFVVRLPARIAAPQKAPAQDARLASTGPRRRILVADDNPDSAATLQIMLEVMGNDVRVARDGEEAVQIAEAFLPDAILLDIGMPRMNGYDACSRIRSGPAGSDAFIVALTGWSQDDLKMRSQEAGFDRHLVKPVEPVTLERMIRSLPASGAVARA